MGASRREAYLNEYETRPGYTASPADEQRAGSERRRQSAARRVEHIEKGIG